MLEEFKKFAMKGNVVDLAVGVVIGGAFGKIVTSLVNDIVMPPIGVLTGGVDFADLSFTIKEAAGEASAVTINYGLFINTAIDFIIIALSVFMVVKALNKMKRKEEEKPTEETKPSKEEVLLGEIRDLLKKR